MEKKYRSAEEERGVGKEQVVRGRQVPKGRLTHFQVSLSTIHPSSRVINRVETVQTQVCARCEEVSEGGVVISFVSLSAKQRSSKIRFRCVNQSRLQRMMECRINSGRHRRGNATPEFWKKILIIKISLFIHQF